ncbi:MAG: hypothetical protein AAB250_12145 [Bdellovibrionota bacterium]
MRIRLLLTLSIMIAAIAIPGDVQAQWRIPTWLGGQPEPRPAPRPPPRRPEPVRCLGTTDPNDLTVERGLQNPRQNSFLQFYNRPSTQANFVNACRAEVRSGSPMNRSNYNAIITGASIRQQHISRTCIRAVIATRANENIETNITFCTPEARNRNTIPCLTDRYVNYVQFSLNSAMRCISSNQNPVNPDTVFEMINNESAFMGFVRNFGGVGLMQMTSIAGREIFNIGADGRRHLDAMMARPEKRAFCDPFRGLPVQVGSRSLDACSFVGISQGIPRSAIAGIGLLSYYQKLVQDEIISKGIPRSHPRFYQIVELLALVSYNRGFSQAQLVLSKLGAGNVARNPNPRSLISAAALRWTGMDYLQAMSVRRREIPDLPRTCGELP